MTQIVKATSICLHETAQNVQEEEEEEVEEEAPRARSATPRRRSVSTRRKEVASPEPTRRTTRPKTPKADK